MIFHFLIYKVEVVMLHEVQQEINKNLTENYEI